VAELWARLLAAVDNLSPRERMLVSLVGGVLATMLLYFAVITPLLSIRDRASARVETAEQQIETMLRLRRDYDDFAGRLELVESRIRANRDSRNLLTLLETLASQSGVKIDSMQERQASDNERFRETRVEVDLKNVTLTQTVKYLHNIELSDRQLSVKGLRVRTRPDQPELLDVNFNVSSFEPT